jgi:hypothetical protein
MKNQENSGRRRLARAAAAGLALVALGASMLQAVLASGCGRGAQGQQTNVASEEPARSTKSNAAPAAEPGPATPPSAGPSRAGKPQRDVEYMPATKAAPHIMRRAIEPSAPAQQQSAP